MVTSITERLSFFASSLFFQIFIATALTGLLCGFIGPFLQWRRMSTFASTISHAALTPMALATIWNIPVGYLLYPFSIVLALGITFAEEQGMVESDSIMSLFFSGFMALGAMILLSAGSGSSEAVHYLFGDVVLITLSDLSLLFIITFVICGYIHVYRPELVLICANKDIAISEGIRLRRHVYALNILAAITVGCLLALMGIVLATSLIVGPALIANNFSKNLRSLFILSGSIGVGISIVGLVISILFDLSSGPTISILTLTAFLFSFWRRGKI